VFGADIPELLMNQRADLALAPITAHGAGFMSQTLRRDPLFVALAETDPLAHQDRVKLTELHDRQFEFWPREMAPGFYDTIMAACRAAGFEPKRDEHATGNTAWGYIADGRGVALINRSLEKQLPRGIILRPFDPPMALTIDAVWCRSDRPDIARVLEAARLLASETQWLVTE